MDPADQSPMRAAVEAQGAMLGRHQEELTAAHHAVDTLMRQVTELTETISRMQRDRDLEPPATECVPTIHEPRINNPPVYSGEPTMCRPFIIQCEVVFSLQPTTYALDSSKVAFVISLLTGRAREWATAVWSEKADCCKEFSLFKTEMMKVFDRSALGKEASRLLAALQQGRRSVADFAIEFRTLAASSGWNDEALAARFAEGLAEDIRDEVYARELPEGLDRLVELAIRLDNRRDLRRRVRTSVPTSFQDTPPAGMSPDALVHLPSPEPMQLGRYHLSATEKQQRFTKGLCLYCGKPGHFAALCPAKANARQ